MTLALRSRFVVPAAEGGDAPPGLFAVARLPLPRARGSAGSRPLPRWALLHSPVASRDVYAAAFAGAASPRWGWSFPQPITALHAGLHGLVLAGTTGGDVFAGLLDAPARHHDSSSNNGGVALTPCIRIPLLQDTPVRQIVCSADADGASIFVLFSDGRLASLAAVDVLAKLQGSGAGEGRWETAGDVDSRDEAAGSLHPATPLYVVSAERAVTPFTQWEVAAGTATSGSSSSGSSSSSRVRAALLAPVLDSGLSVFEEEPPPAPVFATGCSCQGAALRRAAAAAAGGSGSSPAHYEDAELDNGEDDDALPSPPLASSALIVGGGSGATLSLHRCDSEAREGTLSQVVAAVGATVKSLWTTLRREWFTATGEGASTGSGSSGGGGGGGPPSPDPDTVRLLSLRAAVPRGSSLDLELGDGDKRVLRVAADPTGRYVLAADSAGRVALFAAGELLLLRLWKGWRDAWVGWAATPAGAGGRSATHPCYLPVIWGPRRSRLVVWPDAASGGGGGSSSGPVAAWRLVPASAAAPTAPDAVRLVYSRGVGAPCGPRGPRCFVLAPSAAGAWAQEVLAGGGGGGGAAVTSPTAGETPVVAAPTEGEVGRAPVWQVLEVVL